MLDINCYIKVHVISLKLKRNLWIFH